MKTINTFLSLCAFSFFFTSCAQSVKNVDDLDVKDMVGEYKSVGDKITTEGVLNIAEFNAAVAGKDSVLGIKLSTTIQEVCKKKGCWMNVDLGDGEDMMVRFKDYAFFVPLDSEGSEIIIQGKAFIDTVSVDLLRHYAEDAGKSEEEINKITEPKSVLAFEATGVLLK